MLELIAEAREAYDGAPREDAEDRFGDYQAWAADGADALGAAARRLRVDARRRRGGEYEAAFNRAVRRRFGELALELEEQEYEDL